MGAPLLEVKDLSVHYPIRYGIVRAVDGVSLKVNKGETLGIVGESGCGKSTLGFAVLGLIPPPGKVVKGEIIFNNLNILRLRLEELRSIRGRMASMVFQDPMTTLNPVMTIKDHFLELFQTHRPEMTKDEALAQAAKMIERLGIPAERLHDYPHQLSGGMRQRVVIGLALALNPLLVVADEPTTALDVIVEAQILELLDELKREFNLTLILITHNIGIVAEHADRIAVMYAGKVVEYAPKEALFENPLHPYTQALLRSVPNVELEKKLEFIPGSPPDLTRPPPGCRFHPRCPYAFKRCALEEPAPFEGEPGHEVSCFLYRVV